MKNLHPTIWCAECGDDSDWCSCAWRNARAEAEEAREKYNHRIEIIERGQAHPLRRHDVKLIHIIENHPREI